MSIVNALERVYYYVYYELAYYKKLLFCHQASSLRTYRKMNALSKNR